MNAEQLYEMLSSCIKCRAAVYDIEQLYKMLHGCVAIVDNVQQLIFLGSHFTRPESLSLLCG